MSKPRMLGFQKPRESKTHKATPGGVARITPREDGGVQCACGWVKVHPRQSVIDRSIDQHVNKKHRGLAVFF